MTQLILTIIGIALTAALAVASINYLPWWQQPAAALTKMLDLSLAQVESAYQVVARAADGDAPAPSGGADGGFAAHFLPVLQFTPAKPAGYHWVYGRVDDLDYFCLAPGQDADEALVAAAWRVLGTRSPDQMKLNTHCGATTSYSRTQALGEPLAITYWVAYSPDIPR
jgi:hypothetical protein